MKCKKIKIEDFISDKKLRKIGKVIANVTDLDNANDEVEQICNSCGLKTKGTGTNRLVFTSDVSDKIVIKVAYDWHGREANQREYHNSALSKSFAKTYSISKDSSMIVQELVNNFKYDEFNKRIDDIRKMLKKLESKVLLCDCRLSNYKNFGYRNNGDVCILDYGDIIPLKIDVDNIINFDEDVNVSLKCKNVVDDSNLKHMKMCGGKLKYDRNTYANLICKKCHHVWSIDEAAQDFFGNSFKKSSDEGIKYTKELIDWMQEKQILKNNAEERKETTEMKKTDYIKQIMHNGVMEDCRQIRGFWIPTKFCVSKIYAMEINSVKFGTKKPADFLSDHGYDINQYKVDISDHHLKNKNTDNNVIDTDKSESETAVNETNNINVIVEALTDMSNNNTYNGYSQEEEPAKKPKLDLEDPTKFTKSDYYYIPNELVDKCKDDDGEWIKRSKIKSILKKYNYHLNDLKVSSGNDDDESESEDNNVSDIFVNSFDEETDDNNDDNDTDLTESDENENADESDEDADYDEDDDEDEEIDDSDNADSNTNETNSDFVASEKSSDDVINSEDSEDNKTETTSISELDDDEYDDEYDEDDDIILSTDELSLSKIVFGALKCVVMNGSHESQFDYNIVRSFESISDLSGEERHKFYEELYECIKSDDLLSKSIPAGDYTWNEFANYADINKIFDLKFEHDGKENGKYIALNSDPFSDVTTHRYKTYKEIIDLIEKDEFDEILENTADFTNDFIFLIDEYVSEKSPATKMAIYATAFMIKKELESYRNVFGASNHMQYDEQTKTFALSEYDKDFDDMFSNFAKECKENIESATTIRGNKILFNNNTKISYIENHRFNYIPANIAPSEYTAVNIVVANNAETQN